MNAMRIAGLVALALLGAAEGEAQSRVRLGTIAPSGTSYHRILLEMGERLRSCPDGGVQLTVYPGGVLGGEGDHVRKMRIGQIQAAMLTAAGIGEIESAAIAFQRMPMMFRSLEEVDFVRGRLAATLDQRLYDKGFVVLFWGNAGWLRFFTRSEALRPDDLKRLKIYVAADDTEQLDLLRDAGFNGVPLELSDALTGLKTGMVDAVPTVPFHALAGQFYTVTRHMLGLDWVPLVGAAVITRKSWEALTPAVQGCFREAALEAGRKIEARSQAENDEALEAMRAKHGLRVHPVSPEVEAEWRRTAEEFYPAIRGRLVPAEFFDEVRRLLAEYRAQAGLVAR